MGRKALDPNRMGASMQRGGIDPRRWLVWAVVVDLGFDPKQGMFADVKFLDDGTEETAFISGPYVGTQCGLYFPMDIDDRVLVAIPNGDPNAGPCIIARAWNAGDPPAAEMGTGDEPIKNVVMKLKQAVDYLMILQNGNWDVKMGSGKISFQTTGDLVAELKDAILKTSGKAYLGDTVGALALALAERVDAKIDALSGAFDVHMHPTAGTGAPSPPTPVPGKIPVAPIIAALPPTAAKKGFAV